MFAVLLTLFAAIPNETVLDDSFDRVELNHFYDDEGRHIFDQVIWYDWDIHNRHTIHAWRLVKNPSVIPILNRETGLYQSIFFDNDVLRKVTAKYYIETWTQYDVELVDREFLKKELRRDLQNAKVIKKQLSNDLGIIFRIFGVPVK